MSEVWRDIPGFDNHYEASSLGRIRAKERTVIKKSRTGNAMEQRYQSRVLSPCTTSKHGRLAVGLDSDGKRVSVSAHRLVLYAFVGPQPDGCECCHNNGDASDNRVENLRWGTKASNAQDRKAHGHYLAGENHPNSRLTDAQVLGIRDGSITRRQAVDGLGISSPHYYQIKLGRVRNTVNGIEPKPPTIRPRLTPADISKIQEMLAQGETQVSIGKVIGVGQGAISRVKCGQHRLTSQPDRNQDEAEAA